MTDTNDLRRMLDELADETPELPAQEWITGTQHKVRVRRRARWAGAAAAVALVIAAAVAVVPQVVNTAEPEPVAPPSEGQPGWPLSAEAKTERIIAARMNDDGTSELRWTTRSPGERIELGERRSYRRPVGAQFCHLPEGTAADESPIRLVSSIDGQVVASTACRHWAGYPPVSPAMVRARPPALEKFGLERGELFTVTMWLERDGERIEMADVEFGFLLYWECQSRGGPRPKPGIQLGTADACETAI